MSFSFTAIRSFILSLPARFISLSLRNKIIAGVLFAAVILGGWFFIQSNQNTDGKTLTLKKEAFVQQVSVSGKVVATNDVDLGFNQSGRIENILVDVGASVSKGDRLASLNLGTLAAELQAANAQLHIKEAQYENTGINLEEVKKQQDTAVASAHHTLLSSNLTAIPASASYGVTAPVISGLYLADQEGTYKISVDHGPQQGTNFKLYYFGIENSLATIISERAPTPLGTKGLYVSFPDGTAAYDGTSWYVDLPNKTSASYVANYNAYQEALRSRDKAVADAEAELRNRSEGATIAAATIDASRAEVARIQALIGERSILSPFNGIVSKVPVDVGETVAVNQNVISLIGDGLFVDTYVPEINISLVHTGNPASITLDAYGDATPFTASVVSIDPDETLRDGVATYRVKLHFDTTDERVRPGMTANVVITTLQKDNVIAVPQGVVKTKGKDKTVIVEKNGSKETRVVTTGAVSAVGNIEILSGLSEGEVVVLQ